MPVASLDVRFRG